MILYERSILYIFERVFVIAFGRLRLWVLFCMQGRGTALKDIPNGTVLNNFYCQTWTSNSLDICVFSS